MGRHYGQLSLEERIEIYRLHAGGISCRKIAGVIGRHRTMISRELKRNSKPTKVWRDGYAPARAQELALRRRRWDCRFKLARQPDLRRLVKSGMLSRTDRRPTDARARHTIISHESIYRYAYHRSAQKDYWHRLLPRHKSRRGHYGRQGGSSVKLIKHRVPIAQRPAEAIDRAQSGHWEADYMLFAKYGDNVFVLHERQTRFTYPR